MINNILNETIVSSDVLEILKLMDENLLEKLYERIKIEKPTILSQDILKEYLVFDVSKKNGTGTLTINKFVEMLNARYNLFQKILVRKVGFEKLISINKCSSGQATIIGIVDTKEIKNDKIKVFLKKKRNLPLILEVMKKFEPQKFEQMENLKMEFHGATYS